MNEPGAYTYQEILSQPETWAASLPVVDRFRSDLQRLYQAGQYDQVIFTGCGSSYYLSLAAAALFRELTGRAAVGLPASELWLSPQSAYPRQKRLLLLAFSRSGETSETLNACRDFLQQKQGDLVTLSCYGDKPLAGMGSLNLVFPAGMETSVAQTRSFSTLYLAATALAAILGGQMGLVDALPQLPAAGREVLDRFAPVARRFGQDLRLDRFYFLGSGPRYGLACELSLKMKEMSLSHSEPFHFMEFRHGPMAMVTDKAVLVGLLSSRNLSYENKVLEEMQQLGGLMYSDNEKGALMGWPPGLDEALKNILFLPAGQLLAFERSLAKGLNPDQPKNLGAVVRLASE